MVILAKYIDFECNFCDGFPYGCSRCGIGHGDCTVDFCKRILFAGKNANSTIRAQVSCRNAQKPVIFFGNCEWRFQLTLLNKSGKVSKVNATTKPSTRNHSSFRELPFGARQQEGRRRIPF